MNKIGIRIGTVILTFLLSYPLMSMAQPHCVRKLTKETQSWLQRLYQAAKEHKPYIASLTNILRETSARFNQLTHERQVWIYSSTDWISITLPVLGLRRLIKKNAETIWLPL